MYFLYVLFAVSAIYEFVYETWTAGVFFMLMAFICVSLAFYKETK